MIPYARFQRTQGRDTPPLQSTRPPYGVWFFLLSIFKKDI